MEERGGGGETMKDENFYPLCVQLAFSPFTASLYNGVA
jgi:hypothetical protein